MKAENYQSYLTLFKENMQQAIESSEDEKTKQVLEDIDPLTEDEWNEAMELGLFDHEMNEEDLKKLYEELSKLYPQNEEDEDE